MNAKRALFVMVAAGLAWAAGESAWAQEKEPPAAGCVLLETKSFGEDERAQATAYANSFSGPTGASVDGVPYVYRNTVRVVQGSLGQRVTIVKIWMCPQPGVAGAGAGVGDGAKPGGAGEKPPAKPPQGPDVPTFDPRFYELRDGKVVPKPGAPPKKAAPPGRQDDHSRCDKPARFECGQHYLWWLEHHHHVPAFDFGQDLDKTPAAPGPPRFDFGQDLHQVPANPGPAQFDFGLCLGRS